MPDSKYFGIPFATSGDKITIPEAVQPSGAISFTQGFGPDYERNPATDPLAKRVPRDETNELYFQVTNSLKYLQLYGLPEWYTGVSYPLNARVRYADEGWRSIVAANTATPGTDGTKWVLAAARLIGDTDIPVKGTQSAPPGSPAAGDTYVVGGSPTGAWAGQATRLATYYGTSWSFLTPAAGLQVQYWSGRQIVLRFDGTSWAEDLAGVSAPGRVATASQADADAGTGEGALQTKHQRRVYSASGTANALTIAPTNPATAYVGGQIWYVGTGAANTGAVTLSISGMPAKSVRDALGFELPAGYLGAGSIVGLQYDNANFRVVSGDRPIIPPFSVVDTTSQALANSISSQVSFGPNGSSYNFVGSVSGGVFTFARPGLYIVSVDATLTVNVVGANQISGNINLVRDGSPTAGAAPNDNAYAAASGGFAFNLSAATALSVSSGTTLSVTAKVTANSNYTSGACTRCGLTIWPVN